MNSKKFARILLIFGLIGLLASFMLTVDTFRLSKDPNIDLPCNINPFVSCTSVINSSQGEVFGFPNPILGIAGFAAIVATALVLLTGGLAGRRFWNFFLIGASLAIVLVHWFIYESIFVLGSLCIYCMITWSSTWPIFLYSWVERFKEKGGNFVSRNHLAILAGWYLLVIFLILFKFKDYFLS